MANIERWPGEQIDGPGGVMWVRRSEALAVSRSLEASNREIVRLEAQCEGALESNARLRLALHATLAEPISVALRERIHAALTNPWGQ